MKKRSWITHNPISRTVSRTVRAGFTLLEMMVVIGIIGVLAAFLIPNIQDALSQASVTAEKANMREVYTWLTMYKNSNNQSWPTESGQKFIMKLWKSGLCERSEKNAKRFFSAGESHTEYLAILGLAPEEIDVLEYLSDWDAIEPGYINYAGFDPQGDPSLRRKLKTASGQVTILANATFAHRNDIVYMTADGEPHSLNIQELLDEGVLTQDDIDSGMVPVGLSSPIEALQTVTND
jgi:prepilin-type N-terminal cleavage/methylation domain-containing protein